MYYATYGCTVTLDTPTPNEYVCIHVPHHLWLGTYTYHKRHNIALAMGLRQLVTTPAVGAAPGMLHMSSRGVYV